MFACSGSVGFQTLWGPLFFASSKFQSPRTIIIGSLGPIKSSNIQTRRFIVITKLAFWALNPLIDDILGIINSLLSSSKVFWQYASWKTTLFLMCCHAEKWSETVAERTQNTTTQKRRNHTIFAQRILLILSLCSAYDILTLPGSSSSSSSLSNGVNI